MQVKHLQHIGKILFRGYSIPQTENTSSVGIRDILVPLNITQCISELVNTLPDLLDQTRFHQHIRKTTSRIFTKLF